MIFIPGSKIYKNPLKANKHIKENILRYIKMTNITKRKTDNILIVN
jgi:hypothetical protein